MRKTIDTVVKKLQKRTPMIMDFDKFAQYAVLLPLIQKDDEMFVLFEVRSLQLRRQPGEICFPGGKMDLCDQSPRETAIRETCEELGIEREHITHIVPLDYMFSPFGMVIYPFVAFVDIVHMQINEKEVEDVFTVPLTFFVELKRTHKYIAFNLNQNLKTIFRLTISQGEGSIIGIHGTWRNIFITTKIK